MSNFENTYCYTVQILKKDGKNSAHIGYHDNYYGFPITSDDELFGRLILEINQAGLSWITILNKEHNFKKAYDLYNIEKIGSYGSSDISRLLDNAGIIRNRLKINAVIYNAQQVLKIQQKHGSFREWLDQHIGLSKEEWVKLFKGNFKFTGGEITGEFLMSIGILEGAHHIECPIYQKTVEAGAPFAKE